MFVEVSEKLMVEAEVVVERLNRELAKLGKQPVKVDLTVAKVAFLVDAEQKSTVCLLKTGKKRQVLTAGVAKRATYEKMADEYSAEKGEAISFSRAVRNFATGVKGSCVTL